MSNNSGGPAFPLVYVVPPENVLNVYQGISVRDYFAAKAMMVIRQTAPNCLYTDIANYAYEMADAMLKAREASNGS